MNFAPALLLLAIAAQQQPTHVLVRDTAYPTVPAAPGTLAFIDRDRIIVTHPRDGFATEITAAGIRQVGRKGEGPGEFRRPSYAGYFADTLWVADALARAVTTFGPSPVVHLASIEGQDASPRAYLGNGFVLATTRSPVDSGKAAIVRIKDGRATTIANIPSSQSVTVMFGSTIAEGAMRMVHPLSNHPRFGIDVTRGRLVIVDRAQTNRYAIRWLDLATGEVVDERTYEIEAERADPTVRRLADWWWYRSGSQSRVPEARFKERFIEAVGEGIRYLPSAGEVIVSKTGVVWVEGPPRSPAETSRWTIIQTDGRVLGTLDVPPRRTLLSIDGDQALVLEDEATIAKYRVMRRAAPR